MKLKKPPTLIELMATSRGVVKARRSAGEPAGGCDAECEPFDTGSDALNRALDKLEKLIGRPS